MIRVLRALLTLTQLAYSSGNRVWSGRGGKPQSASSSSEAFIGSKPAGGGAYAITPGRLVGIRCGLSRCASLANGTASASITARPGNRFFMMVSAFRPWCGGVSEWTVCGLASTLRSHFDRTKDEKHFMLVPG